MLGAFSTKQPVMAIAYKKHQVTRGSNESIIWSLYALRMSADVIIAVLQTALLGFFRDFTTSEITSSLFTNIMDMSKIVKQTVSWKALFNHISIGQAICLSIRSSNKNFELTAYQALLPCEILIGGVHYWVLHTPESNP